MNRRLAAALAISAVLVAAPVARASSFHEKVEVKAIEGGLQLTLTLRPNEYSGHTKVRIGLGPMNWQRDNRNYDSHRKAASDPKAGYLLYQFPEIKNLKPGKEKAREVTLTVLYADAPNLKPGKEVEVITAWNAPSNKTYWHVWGMQAIYPDKSSVKKLPQPKKPRAAKPAAAKPAAAKDAKPPAKPPAKPAAKPAKPRTKGTATKGTTTKGTGTTKPSAAASARARALRTARKPLKTSRPAAARRVAIRAARPARLRPRGR